MGGPATLAPPPTHNFSANTSHLPAPATPMKLQTALALGAVAASALAAPAGVAAFQSSAVPSASAPASPFSPTALHEYIPAGFTPEQWKKFKGKEADKKRKQNLGRMGPKGFKSRSFQSFQEALEKGEATHLMPVFNAKQRVAKGELKQEDIPYMQRGGSWDNTDVRGAKKVAWLKSDKEYASGGFKKEQSVSIFGYGEGLDWTGKKKREGPRPGEMRITAQKLGKNYKAPNVNDMKKEKKGPFGLW